MLFSQRRNQSKGLVLIVVLAVLALQLMPTYATADGSVGTPPPPTVTDTTSEGTHCWPGDQTESGSLSAASCLLDLVLLLMPLL